MLPSEGSEKVLFHASPLASGGLLAGWIAEASPGPCLHLPMAFVGVYLCPYFPLYKDISHIGLSAYPTPVWSHSDLTDYICSYPVSKGDPSLR